MKGKQGFQIGHGKFSGSEKGEFKKGDVPYNKGIAQSKEAKEKQRRSWTLEKREKARREKLQDRNPHWKGDDVGYSGVHLWIYKKLGAPNYCERCKRSNKKKYHWANKDHKYQRRIEDYMRLCAGCHIKYDMENNNRPDNYH
jgi:hypothetical protein